MILLLHRLYLFPSSLGESRLQQRCAPLLCLLPLWTANQPLAVMIDDAP